MATVLAASAPPARLHVDREGVGPGSGAALLAQLRCTAGRRAHQPARHPQHLASTRPVRGPWIVELFTIASTPRRIRISPRSPTCGSSAHFLIRRKGALAQFVPCRLRAWHAGESVWRRRRHCNDFSIGVELEGTDELPYDEAQYTTLARLTRALRRRYPLRDIAGHEDIAPGRKTDPGPAFDWKQFRKMIAPTASQAT